MSDPINSITPLSQLGIVTGTSALSSKESISKTFPKDSLSISKEAQELQKIAEWVEEIKAMPELRVDPQSISKEMGSVTPEALRMLAEKLTDEFK